MKYIIKLISLLIAAIATWPLVLLSKISDFFSISVLVGHMFLGGRIRYSFYRKTMDFVGDSVYFCFGCNFSYPNISIGNNVRIGYGTCVGLVDIGDDTLIGAYCCLLSGAHMHGIERTDIPIRLQEGYLERISIGRDCWLGANVVVMADIGEGCVIGSGAVVTKPVPPWSIVVGNPAKVIRSRKQSD